MAFILVQHQEAKHDSLIVELLAPHSAMAVVQAAEGMQVRPDHLYVIPPGVTVSVAHCALHSRSLRHAMARRLPFDFLLHSVAEAYGRRETLGAMSGMLSTLLDINQIDAGVVRPEITLIDLAALIEVLCAQFNYHAEAQALALRVMVAEGVMVRSDAKLLALILRNLTSNALNYTRQCKVLLGCRRRGPIVSIQVWDTGIGIPDFEL